MALATARLPRMKPALFDMAQKYADVLSCAEIAAHLRDIK
jgi:hypothetical protein